MLQATPLVLLEVSGRAYFFSAIAAQQIYGKKTNPHHSVQDRNKQIKTVANVMVFSSIASTVFITINFLLVSLELRHLNYDVYRNAGTA